MSTVIRPLPEEGVLRQRLAALRRRLRLVATCRGAGWLLALFVLTAAANGYLDWKYRLHGIVRAAELVALLGGAAVLAYRYLYRPLSARSDDLSLALRVEERYPVLNDSLASTVEFLNQAAPPTGESVAVRREAVRRALSRSGAFDFNRVVDTRGLRLAGSAAGVALALAVTLLILFPTVAATALVRLAVPFGSSDWPRLTQLELEEPRTRIGRNEGFELRGKVKGVIPDNATVVFQYDNFPERRETLRLTPADGQAKLFKRWKPDEVSSSFKFQVLANDAESKVFTVEVVPPPELTLLEGEPSPQVRLDIPRYTDLPTPLRLPPGTGNVEAIAGTVVTLRAAADRPLKRAWVQYIPDLNYAHQSAILTPLGATDPLTAATLAVGGETVWGLIPAVLDANPARFTIRFLPRVAGLYVLTLEDETGLRSAPRVFELRLRQDPPPIVRLERPSAGRDVLSVLPNGKLLLNIVAEDPVFALRSVFLRYRTKEDDAPRDWVYYDHATAAEKLFAPLFGAGVLAAPPRLRPTRLEIEMPLPIAQFKHRDGTPLRPGDVLILQACADDFDDVSVNKAPGSSPELRLAIVDHSGLERDLNRDLTIIQNVLKEQRDKEQAALQQTARAENRLKQGENMTTPELEQLAQAEQVQRELRDRFGEKQDQLRGQVRRVQEALKQNGMQNSPMRDRMRYVERELQRIAENDLVQAEQQLARARQQLEASAQAEDRARKAEREAEELLQKARNLSDEAAQKEKDARTTTDAREKEKLLSDAKRIKDQEKELREQAAPLQRQATAARAEAAKLLRESKAGEPLNAARKRQEEVEKTLNDLLARLEPSSAVGEIKGEARDLLDAQKQLQARVEEMELKTRGKKPDELTVQEREDLKALREGQQELEERAAKLMERMRAEAKRREQDEPELAKKLLDAVQQAEKDNVSGEMRDARDNIGENKLGEAGKNQQAGAKGLEKLARKLGRQSEAEQEQLVKRLREAEKELEKIRKEEEELRKKIKELKEGKGGLTPEERKEELKRLEKRQEELQQQAQQLAKRLSREGRAERARQALNKAAKNPDEMLERLNEAERELKRARQREQEVLEREQLTRILEVIERLRDRQSALNAEAARIQKDVKENGDWTRGLRGSLLGLRDGQTGVKAETEEIIPKELADTPVFARMMQRAAEAMALAAKRAEDLVEESKQDKDKQGNAAPDKLPDAELTKQQKQALLRLEQIIDAVKSQLDAPPPQQQKPPKEAGGGEQPEDGSPPPQNGLPPLAQLKLLKALQLDVNKRSEDFNKGHPDLNKLSDAEKSEYNSLIRDQQDVRELLEEMRKPPGEPAGDKEAKPKPDEEIKR